MQYSVESAYAWLYPDSVCSGNTEVRLVAARNGTAAFQVLLNGTSAGRVRMKAAGPFGWDLFRLVPVNVTRNTGSRGFTVEDKGDLWEDARAWCTRKAPFLVYDALQRLPGEGLAGEAGTQALYASVTVPADAGPGVYGVSFEAEAGGERFTLSGTLEVTAAKVEGETLKITNWYSLPNMAKWHGLEPWSEAHWDMIRRYGEWMRRGRQNTFWVTWDTVQATGSAAEGYAFDFSRAERLIRLYLGMGFTTIEGGCLFRRDSWDAVEMKVEAPEGPVPALSREGYAYTAALLTAWRRFIEKNGWMDRLIQHVGDEPHEGCSTAYRMLSGIVRKFLPGVPLLDAVELAELDGAVDIWVPKDDFYEKNRDAFEAHRQKGDTVWIYSCCKPGGHYANRLLDMPLIRCRMLHWGNYVYSLPGFLHWGLNQMRPGLDPFGDTCPNHGWENHFLPAGDSHVVYPSPDGSEVFGSMRLEAEKGGAEEYELLVQLAARDRAAADAVAHACFRRFDDCDNEPAVFEAAREKLLRS